MSCSQSFFAEALPRKLPKELDDFSRKRVFRGIRRQTQRVGGSIGLIGTKYRPKLWVTKLENLLVFRKSGYPRSSEDLIRVGLQYHRCRTLVSLPVGRSGRDFPWAWHSISVLDPDLSPALVAQTYSRPQISRERRTLGRSIYNQGLLVS